MDIETLLSLTGASSKKIILENVKKLTEEYQKRNSPVMIVKEKNGWKMAVRESYLPLVRKIISDTELPKTILETLAVIAWRAPVLQSIVVEIRHNKAYEHIHELLELGFITKEPSGRSFIIKLTNKFFDYFEVEGKEGIRELFKNVKENIEQKKVDEFAEQETVKGLEVYEVDGDEQTESKKPEERPAEHLGPLEVFDEEETGEPVFEQADEPVTTEKSTFSDSTPSEEADNKTLAEEVNPVQEESLSEDDSPDFKNQENEQNMEDSSSETNQDTASEPEYIPPEEEPPKVNS